MSLRLLASLLLALVLGWTASARASNIEISHIALEGNDEGYALDADFEIELNPRLEDAINKGVPLYFEVEFELTRKRWYWFDDSVSRQLMLPRAHAPIPHFERGPVSKLFHPARRAAGAVAGALVAGA
jgi:hypothetical protein